MLGKRKSTRLIQMLYMFSDIKETKLVCIEIIKLTEDSGHRQDEQLQQSVLLLIGQTQEAQLSHFGEVRDSSPYYLMRGRQTLKHWENCGEKQRNI